MSADDVAAAAKYFRRQALVDQRLIDRAAAAPDALVDGLEDLQRRRDLWIQLAEETEAYLVERPAEKGELEFTPPCSEALSSRRERYAAAASTAALMVSNGIWV